MRVVGGRARGHKLKQVPGDTTRPITDRVKESLFDILGAWVVETRWLDLFAGTGQVGIEALSRGANSAVFVDNTRAAVRTVHANLAHTKLSDLAEVRFQDAFEYLSGGKLGKYDAIFIAPPQYKELWIKALQRIDGLGEQILTDEGLVIVQIDPREFREAPLQLLALTDQRKYGNTLLCFYEMPPESTVS